MTASKCEVSRCGLCQFYSHEGRRGGTCEKLSAPVSSRWKACCFAASPFQTFGELDSAVDRKSSTSLVGGVTHSEPKPVRESTLPNIVNNDYKHEVNQKAIAHLKKVAAPKLSSKKAC